MKINYSAAIQIQNTSTKQLLECGNRTYGPCHAIENITLFNHGIAVAFAPNIETVGSNAFRLHHMYLRTVCVSFLTFYLVRYSMGNRLHEFEMI